MKKTIILLSVILSLNIKNILAQDVIVDVNGLVCEFCAVTIEKSFKKMKEINNVKVDLETKKLLINLKKDKNISNQEIIEIIENNGYNVVKINRQKR